MGKASNKTALVVLHHVVKVALEELQFEVGQIEATVVIGCELVSDVQHYLVCMAPSHKIMCHSSANPEHLLVR